VNISFNLWLWVLPLWELLFTSTVGSLGYRSNNFIVGLTNTDPANQTPDLWDYTLCGQYPGTVPDGATVTVQCTNAYNRGLRFRYVIVQFPLINDTMNFCEIEVFTVGRLLINQSLFVSDNETRMDKDTHTAINIKILYEVHANLRKIIR